MTESTLLHNSLPSVTFVVVNWNQCQLTLDCLASLRQQHYPSFSVVLVDNGSQDGSVAAVREAYPEVVVIENGSNLGIAAANNVGIQHALKSGTNYVFLLNNDTVVAPDMLLHLVKVAESEPDIGTTAPTMLYFDPPDVIWCAGASIDWRLGSAVRLREGQPVSSVDNASCQDIDTVASCAVCIKSAVFQSVGLMDDSYFMYYDETDWFARASVAGWRTVYVPWAKMWHKVSATIGTNSPATDYYMNRNVLLFLSKNKTGLARLSSLVLAAGRNLMTVAAYTAKPNGQPRRRNRDARLLAFRDALLGHWGKMGADVAVVCYPKNA